MWAGPVHTSEPFKKLKSLAFHSSRKLLKTVKVSGGSVTKTIAPAFDLALLIPMIFICFPSVYLLLGTLQARTILTAEYNGLKIRWAVTGRVPVRVRPSAGPAPGRLRPLAAFENWCLSGLILS